MAAKQGKKIVLRIPSEQFDALLIAGARMSNLCFNLAQGDKVPAEYRATMKESQLEWDNARSALAGR